MSQNVSVSLQFATSPNFNNGATVYTGTEDSSGNLNFSSLGVTLGPGTYWLTAWVTRPLLPTGGQWFWDETNLGNPNGSEFYLHNPGGQLIGLTDPTAGSVVYGQPPGDLAFVIQGTSVVPEPASMTHLVVAAAVGTGGWYFRRRNCRPHHMPDPNAPAQPVA